MNKMRQFIVIALAILFPILAKAQPYPLQVQVTPKPNFTSFLGMLKENPGKYLSLRVSSAGMSKPVKKNIYFAIKLRQLAPTNDVSLTTNEYKRPLSPVVINMPGTNIITVVQMKHAFDGYTEADFVYTGMGSIDFNNITKGLRLPEGVYSLCFIALDYDIPAGNPPVMLSDPNASCAQIIICYEAAQPMITMPINSLIMPESNYIKKKIEPKKNINFTWLAPISSCGAKMNTITYELKITNLLESQTEDDAANNNPPLIKRENLRSTSFIIDTSAYPNILKKGETYVVQVIAKSSDPNIKIKNQGKSLACSFIYGDEDEEKEEEKEEEKPVRLAVSDINCGVEEPKNKTALSSLNVGDEVTFGDFTMRISEISNIGTGKSFRGKGVIRESIIGKFQYFNWINVIVEFDSLTVNTDKQVIGGYAVGSYGESDLNVNYTEFFRSFHDKAGNWYEKYFNKKVEDAVDDAQKYIKTFKQEIKLGSQVLGLSAQTLPMKIEYNVKGYNINLAVSDMKFTPKGSAFSLLYFLDIPEVNQAIPFGMSDICMDGNPVANGKFALLGDAEIPLGENAKCKLFIAGGGGEDKTYIQWSRQGFEGIALTAKVKIEPESGIISTKKDNKTVDVNIKTEFISWDDWTAEISMDEFKLKDYPDFTFRVKKAVYDHSTKKDPPGYKKIIKEIKEKDKSFKADEEFKGLFFEEIELGLPNYLTGSKANELFKIDVSNAFYDSKGFTFAIGKKNIIDVSTGKLGGWGFSLDTIQMMIVQNSFREGKMSGKLKLPLNEDSTYMKYTSILTNPKGQSMKYEFNVIPTMQYNFLKYFRANVDPTSYVNVKVEKKNNENEVTLEAKLHGSLSATASIGNDQKSDGDNFKLELVIFKNMYLSNRNSTGEPDFVFNIGDWGLGGGTDIPEDEMEKEKDKKQDEETDDKSEGKVGTFSFKLEKPNFSFDKAGEITKAELDKYSYLKGKTKTELVAAAEKGNVLSKRIGIELPISITLGNGDQKMFVGTATPAFYFDVAFDKKFNASPAMYNFDFKFTEVGVEGNFGPVYLEGKLNFYEKDATYGDGFRGAVRCKFPMDITASATVQFGNVKKGSSKKINYFYVDGGINLGDAASLPIAYPLALTGFGGGVWKNMVTTNSSSFRCQIPKINKKDGKFEIDTSITQFENLTKIGASVTGLNYVPVEPGESAFGMRAEIYLAADKTAGGSRMINGKLALSATTSGSEFQNISLMGVVNAIGDGKGKHVVSASAEIKYNHPSRQFALDIGVKANIIKVAKAYVPFKLYVDGKKKKWILGIGEPNYIDTGKCVSLDAGFDFVVIKAKLWAKGYILGGNSMEKFQLPDLPEKVLAVLKTPRSKPMPPSERGFMLGCRAGFDFNFEFGPLYAKLAALIGFDVAVMDRAGMLCSNGDKIGGINGYYSNGQIYGYLHGDVGVQLRFFGKKKRFSLASVTAGSTMQAGLIDPTWMKGNVGVKGSILGGLIKFNTSAKFSIGKKCEILGDPLKDLVIVESVTPGVSRKSEVSSAGKTVKEATVFVSPKIACNVTMNREFDLFSDPEDKESKKRTYKFKFNEAMTKITNLDKPSEVIEFKQSTKNNLLKKGNQFVLKFKKMLPPNTNFKVQVVVDMREVINGRETLPIDDKGKKYKESEARKTYTYYFKTGNLPNKISEDNIVDAYPMNRQFETFVRDGQKGFIILEYSQEYLIKNRDKSLGKDALFGEFINLTDKRKEPIYFNYKYKTYTKKEPSSYYRKPSIEFDLKDLIPGHIYQVKFYVVNKSATVAEHKKETTISEIKISESKRAKLLRGTTGGGSNITSTTTVVDKITKRTSESSGKFTDKSTKEETTLSKTKRERNADIENIFMYYFRTSSYKSITDKMKNIEVKRTGNGYTYVDVRNGEEIHYHDNYQYIGLENSNKDFRLIWRFPYIVVKFPSYTTLEEVGGGKAFEGENAVEATSMFQFINLNGGSYTRNSNNVSTSYTTSNNNYSNPNHYSHIMEKYSNFMYYLSIYNTNDFNIMGNYNKSNLLFSWHNFEKAIPKLNECLLSKQYLYPLEGRLTNYEIQSGRINRSAKRFEVVYGYPHFRTIAQHLGFAMRISDNLMEKWRITWDEHKTKVYEVYGGEGHTISLWVQNLRNAGKQEERFIDLAESHIISNRNPSNHKWGNGRWKTAVETKEKEARKKVRDGYNSNVRREDNILSLRELYLYNYELSGTNRPIDRLFKQATLGKHFLVIEHKRLGNSWEFIKDYKYDD